MEILNIDLNYWKAHNFWASMIFFCMYKILLRVFNNQSEISLSKFKPEQNPAFSEWLSKYGYKHSVYSHPSLQKFLYSTTHCSI